MRVVEYQKQTTALPYQAIKAIGWVAGVFSLVVCALIIANNLSLKKTDPIHSPALQVLVEELKVDPKNEVLREEIRELDQIARRAFFTSQHFNRVGIYLLVGGLVVMVIALKSLEAFKTAPPYPDSSDPKDDIVENAMWARKAVTAVGLVLVGFALMIALPWQSTLDLAEIEGLGEGGGSSGTTAPAPDGSDAGTQGKADPAPAPAVKDTPPAAEPAPAVAAVPVATAEERLKNWPELRGPESGVSRASGVPTEWNGESGDGVRWKVAVPLTGFSSPIIWDGRIYLSGADETTREVYCYDSENGDLLWQAAAEGIPGSPEEPPEVTEDTGYAAATMATDGVRVFAIFSTGDLVALDFEGKQVWAKNVGVPENPYGHSSSLVVYEDLVLVQFDREEHSFVAGFDVATGKERWRTARDFGPSWSSPALIDTGERTELVLAADPDVVSYDPKTGEELWRCEALKRAEVAPTPVYADGLIFVSADYAKFSAIDVKTHELAWESQDLMPGVSTPLVVGNYIISGLSDGGITCHDTKTGEEIWYEDSDDGFYASPVLIGDLVYLLDRAGIMHIFKPADEFEAVARPELGEEATCTAAVIGDSLYLRSMENLYRIGP